MSEDALDHSKETRHLLNNHIHITQLQLTNLEKAGENRQAVTTEAIKRLENALKWAGGLIVSLVLSVLGWAVMQQFNANEAQKREMEQQIQLLQEQERTRNALLQQPIARPAAPATQGQ